MVIEIYVFLRGVWIGLIGVAELVIVAVFTEVVVHFCVPEEVS